MHDIPLSNGKNALKRYGNTQQTKHTRHVAHHNSTRGTIRNNTTLAKLAHNQNYF